tara:strand:+ start:218 stop:382 length:165 start_codon:yes stop_codon:yes gene_type:complete
MKDNYLFRAIKSINENAEFKFQEQDIDTIEWLNGTTPIAKDILETKVQEIKDSE